MDFKLPDVKPNSLVNIQYVCVPNEQNQQFIQRTTKKMQTVYCVIQDLISPSESYDKSRIIAQVNRIRNTDTIKMLHKANKLIVLTNMLEQIKAIRAFSSVAKKYITVTITVNGAHASFLLITSLLNSAKQTQRGIELMGHCNECVKYTIINQALNLVVLLASSNLKQTTTLGQVFDFNYNGDIIKRFGELLLNIEFENQKYIQIQINTDKTNDAQVDQFMTLISCLLSPQ